MHRQPDAAGNLTLVGDAATQSGASHVA
jgi:hypothetical protein